MKKFNKVLAMAMVGALTLGGSQVTHAVLPTHYAWCDCFQCQMYDQYYKEDMDQLTMDLFNLYATGMDEASKKGNPENYANTLKGDRMIPVDESYSVGMKMPLVDGRMPLHYGVSAENYIYGRDGAASIANTVLSFIQTEDGVAQEEQTQVQTYAQEIKLLDYVSGLLYSEGVELESEKFSDMLQLQETMAAGEGKRMILLDIDPSVISNKDTDEYIGTYKDFVRVEPHTVILKGIYVNENNEITMSIYDPYTNLISSDVSQHRLRAMTLGMGYSSMIVVDYDKH